MGERNNVDVGTQVSAWEREQAALSGCAPASTIHFHDNFKFNLQTGRTAPSHRLCSIELHEQPQTTNLKKADIWKCFSWKRIDASFPEQEDAGKPARGKRDLRDGGVPSVRGRPISKLTSEAEFWLIHGTKENPSIFPFGLLLKHEVYQDGYMPLLSFGSGMRRMEVTQALFFACVGPVSRGGFTQSFLSKQPP